MSSSTKPNKAGNIWSKNRLYKLASNRPEGLYQDLSLPLNLFIKCIIDGDLTCLIIRGQHSGDKLALAWGKIYNLYLDSNYENDVLYPLQLKKEIVLLDSHITEVELCIYFLERIYHQGLVDILQRNGYKINSSFNDKKNWIKSLTGIRNRLSRKKLDLATKLRELELYVKAHENDEITEKYFVQLLSRLAKYQGVAIIRTKDITVHEFVTLLHEYLNYYKRLEADGKEG